METHEIIRGLREDRDLTQQNMADMLQNGSTLFENIVVQIKQNDLPQLLRMLKPIN